MTDPNRRLLVGLIDRSGSMDDIREDTQGGWRTFLREQADPAKNGGYTGETLVSLYEFDDQFDVVYENTPIAEAPRYRLAPRGGTALLDAIAETITRVGNHLSSLPEEARYFPVVLTILTDGAENSSREFSARSRGAERVKEMITRQQDEYSWVINFMGAGLDAVKVGETIGVRRMSALSYARGNTTDAFSSVSGLVSRGTETGEYAFTDEDRKAAQGGQ